MVALFTKEQINNLGIDNIERAIVFSALALQLAIFSSDNVNELKKKLIIKPIRKGVAGLDLRIDALVPYDVVQYARVGGVAVNAVQELNTGINIGFSQLQYSLSPSDPVEPIIPDFDEDLIDTFEKYFVYYTAILFASLSENRNSIIELIPQSNGFDGAELKIKITFPLDVVAWATGTNLIAAIKRVATEYTQVNSYQKPPTDLTFLNDDVLLTDETLLTD